MSPTSRPLIVVFLPQEWSEYVRRPHWAAIYGRADLLAVEPPAGLLSLFRHPSRLLHYLGGDRKPRLSTSGVKLWRPLALASHGLAFRIPWLARLDRWWIGRQLRPIVRSLTNPNQAVVSTVVKIQQYYLRDMVDADLQFYEVTDEYRVSTSDPQLDPSDPWTVRLTKWEKGLLADAGLVIVASAPLLESRSRENPNTHHLSNCVEYDHFSQQISDWRSIAGDLAELPEPRLGYVGGFNDLMDIDLLIRLAETYREGSLIVVGEERGSLQFRTADNYRRLKSMSNVFFLGHKPYDQLPAYMRGLDVGLLPFRCNEWIRNSSPNKTYQYLAAGKPVVSTDFPEARRVEAAVLVARDHDQFSAMVETALSSSGGEVRIRKELAQANSTEVRAEAVLKLINRSLLSAGDTATSD